MLAKLNERVVSDSVWLSSRECVTEQRQIKQPMRMETAKLPVL